MSVPSWRFRFHLNLFLSPDDDDDDDDDVVSVIDPIVFLIFCILVLTCSAPMSKEETKCPQNVNMTRTRNETDQTRVWAWILIFEVVMHLSMRHMTMTTNETTWWWHWVAWQTASFDLSQWGSARQWIWQKLPNFPIFSRRIAMKLIKNVGSSWCIWCLCLCWR